MNPERKQNHSMLAAVLLAGATMPSLAGCGKGGGGGIVIEPVPQVTLARHAALPGPFAPEQIQVLVGGSIAPGTIEIYQPGQPTSGAPSMEYTPGTSVIFSLPGTYTARVGVTGGAIKEVPFQVNLDFEAFLNLEPNSAVLGTGPAMLTLRNASNTQIPEWELRAFRFNPMTLELQRLDFSTPAGPVASLETSNGTIPFTLSQLLVTSSDSVVYVQASALSTDGKSSCVFAPLFIPYQGIPQLPMLGVDIGSNGFAPRQGSSLDIRLSGVDGSTAIRMRPIALTTHLIDMVVPGNSHGAAQTVSVAIPNIGALVPTLWYLQIVISRSDGTRSYDVVLPILPS